MSFVDFDVANQMIGGQIVEKFLKDDNQNVFDGPRQYWPKRFCDWTPVCVQIIIRALFCKTT